MKFCLNFVQEGVFAIFFLYKAIFPCRCEEVTEVEAHHQQALGSTGSAMGVAEDETPSSITSHPNLSTSLNHPNPNPNQEGMPEFVSILIL